MILSQADLCYTPMMYANKFVEDEAYRTKEFHTHKKDRPLVVHFCGNEPKVLLKAARLVESECDAIDLNLGCPQRIAYSGHFGSYLLGEEDRELVVSIVKTMAAGLTIPVFCKIRLLESVPETIALCKALAGAGCKLIAVHARYRGTATRRRDGPAHLDQVKLIKKAMGNFPIIANGNVQCPADVASNLEATDADGIMSAEGYLDNPALMLAQSVKYAAAAKAAEDASSIIGADDAAEDAGKDADDTADAASAADKPDVKGPALTELKQQLDEVKAQLQAITHQPNPFPKSQPDPVEDKATKNKRKRLKQKQAVLNDRIANYGGNSEKLRERRKLAKKLRQMDALQQLTRPLLEEEKAKLLTKAGLEQALRDLGADVAACAASNQDPRWAAANDKLKLACEYLDLCHKYPSATLSEQVFHVRRICKEELTKYQLLEQCCASKNAQELSDVLKECRYYKDGTKKFVYDAQREERAKEALADRKREQSKRKNFEERMIRKAKREDKPTSYYLDKGAATPLPADLTHAKTLENKEQMAWWREKFGQHCSAFHLVADGCARGYVPGTKPLATVQYRACTAPPPPKKTRSSHIGRVITSRGRMRRLLSFVTHNRCRQMPRCTPVRVM